MPNCPKCNAKMSGPECKRCGYAEAGSASLSNFNYMRCEWLSDGERCRNAGTISSATTGHGPWYCHAHFRTPEMHEGHRIVEESQAAIDQNARYDAETMVRGSRSLPPLAKRLATDTQARVADLMLTRVRGDGKDWSRRIMARVEAGERVQTIAQRYAMEALGISAA